MTTSTAMDINTFCQTPIWIPTVKDDDQEAWFLLNTHVRAALELPEGFDHEEFLAPDEWSHDLFQYNDGQKEERCLVSEAGLYKLILLSEGSMFTKFKRWVMEVVAPTISEDGLYEMGEEGEFPSPVGYSLTHSHIWDGDACCCGSARSLATHYLPELRRYGTADDIIVADKQGKRSMAIEEIVLAARRKLGRKLFLASKASASRRPYRRPHGAC